MGLAPAFKRNDTVYLASSSAIGQLEGYRIASVLQKSPGLWQYYITFLPKPPETATIGDRFDQRTPPYTVLYAENELQTLCNALKSVVNNLKKRLTNITRQMVGICPTLPIEPQEDTPSYQVDDLVYILASAKIGFMEKVKISTIHSVQSGTASNVRRFVYQLTVKPMLSFSEDELTDFCHAAELVKTSLNDQLTEMSQKLAAEQCN